MRSKGLIPALAAAALLFAVQSRADGLIPEGAPNIATTSGAKSSTFENMHPSNKNSLFNGVRDRWLGYVPKPATDYYPSETVTFQEARPIINAYRVLGAPRTRETSTRAVRRPHGSSTGPTTAVRP